jgi:GntR family transcriptional regulator/MocR family aminotransferase
MARTTECRIDEASWLSLERRAGETLRAALERSLRDAIREGALRAGVRLPSSRALARQLGVSRGVVSDAYAQLEAQGFLRTRARAAPVVAPVRPPAAARPLAAAPPARPRYDLAPTTPDVTLFPRRAWVTAVQHAARAAPASALDYGEARGERVLREVLADHLGRTRGAIAEADRIIVVQGTAQAVDLLLRVAVARGARRFALEDPSHRRQAERAQALGLDVVAQPVDRDGLVVDGLDADAVLVTPAHQFPTGAVLSSARRRALLAWAQAGDRRVVEDDYDSEFRYDREPVRSLQGLDPDRVVLVGTVSKTLVPALRLGWIVVPPALVDDAERTKRLLDDASPALDQLALARLLTSGDYDRHVRRSRARYAARRDRLLAALRHHLPELGVEGVAAGVHLVVRLPAGVDDAAASAAAARRGAAVPALSSFRLGASGAPGLVLGYGRLPEPAIEPAIASLATGIRPLLAPARRARAGAGRDASGGTSPARRA